MGIFGRRKSREEKAAEIAGQVASGKGFYGRATRAFLGNEDYARVQQSMGAYNSGLGAQQLLAAGAPTTTAVVVSIADTGQLVNHDPVVDLVVQPTGSTEQIPSGPSSPSCGYPAPATRSCWWPTRLTPAATSTRAAA